MAVLSLWNLASLLLFSTVSATTFGCNNADMTDRGRQMYLDTHNRARESMAKGNEPNICGNLTSGKNVYRLSWDCKLEEAAAKYLKDNDCPNSMGTFTGLGTVAQNLQSGNGLYTSESALTSAANAMNSWWAQARTVGITDPDNKYTSSSLYQFSNMANGETTGIGCAHLICGTKLTILCLYNGIGYYTNGIIYEKGDPCTTDADCTTYPGSTCDGGLCYKAIEQTDSGANTVCPTNPSMTDAVRAKFIEMHNYLRSRGARGLEADGAGGNAPKGSKMLKMTYDCEIEKTAQAWSDNCVWQHSADNTRVHGGVQSGENMYYTSALNADKVAQANSASNSWWKELLDFGVGPENNLTDAVWAKGVGHYTQMAWDTTERLGCGVTWCSDKTFVVCQYGPAGNYPNRLIYSLGEPCSACPSGYSCDSSGGLCEKP